MKTNYIKLIALFCLALSLLLFAFSCGDDDDDNDGPPVGLDDDDSADDDDDDDNDDDNHDDDDDDDTNVSVIYERLLVPGATAPPNPETGAETPQWLNNTVVYRFREDTGDDDPRPVNGVVIMIPGYAAGASDFFKFAYDLVEMSQGKIEVWSMDRRSNLLEDQLGLDKAEAEKDPTIVDDYYNNGLSIGGETFDGFLDSAGPETDMISEWGLDLHMWDLRKVIEMVPETDRATNVFIGGHSSGARTAQVYAAYEFDDGHFGSDDLAGILLLDFQGNIIVPTEAEYLQDIEDYRTGAKDRCGVMEQAGDSVANVVFIEKLAMITTEGYGGQDPQMGPDGLWPEWGLFELVFIVSTRGHDVILTNATKFGLIFDNDYTLAGNNFYGHMGALTGGEVSQDALGKYPSEDGKTYYWLDYDQSNPEENMGMQSFLKLIYEGPSDFTEWYYPARFDLEDNLVGNLETTGKWQHNYFKLYTSQVDVAVFALEGATPAGTGFYEAYRDVLPPVRGSSKPRTEEGFHIEQLHDWGHVEVLLTMPDRNPFLESFEEFVYEWTDGQVAVPEFEK